MDKKVLALRVSDKTVFKQTKAYFLALLEQNTVFVGKDHQKNLLELYTDFCDAQDLHTIALGSLERTCWRWFAVQ